MLKVKVKDPDVVAVLSTLTMLVDYLVNDQSLLARLPPWAVPAALFTAALLRLVIGRQDITPDSESPEAEPSIETASVSASTPGAIEDGPTAKIDLAESEVDRG